MTTSAAVGYQPQSSGACCRRFQSVGIYIVDLDCDLAGRCIDACNSFVCELELLTHTSLEQSDSVGQLLNKLVSMLKYNALLSMSTELV